MARGEDPLPGPFQPVFFLEFPAQQPKGDGGFGGGARLGDDIHGKIALADHVQQVLQIRGREVGAGEIDLWPGPAACRQMIVEGMRQKGDRRLGAQIRAADADHHQHFRLLANALGSRPDGVDLRAIHLRGPIEPTQEIVAGAFPRSEQSRSLLDLRLDHS